MEGSAIHRPRNVDWKRAAGLLYGDWGTSKAYVIGAAFIASAYSSLPIIVAVSILTALVGYNYTVICKHFPDGGGVYSAARNQSRLVAVIGALMLVANFCVTAALSGWTAMNYFRVPPQYLAPATMALILVVGAINYFGPKHSGSLAMTMAVPMVVVVVAIIGLSLPYLSVAHLVPSKVGFANDWMAFVGVILALSGVEAIANLTGVMKLDEGSSMEKPVVTKTAGKAIWGVAAEVVLGTALLGWAMLSLPVDRAPMLHERWEDMLSVLAEQYGSLSPLGPVFGKYFGIVTGVIVGVLLLSAVNTAIGALIGLMYLLGRDGEMPKTFTRLNSHGVPWIPMFLAALMPFVVVAFSPDQLSLMQLYAIGVVGAIAVNLGSCLMNRSLKLHWYEWTVMLITFITLFAVEVTLAKTKHNALFFIVCILIGGLSLRSWAQRRAGYRTITVSKEIAAAVAPETVPDFQLRINPGQSILVAARGLTPVLRYAMEEARLRQGVLYVVYVKELAVSLPGSFGNGGRPKWQDDRQAAEIMSYMLEQGTKNDVQVIPLYSVSENPAGTIVDLAATLGADILMLGASHRRTLASLLKGNVVTEVAKNLPENIELIIHS
jgi:amino acid transporter/nucleotide-binding universal stress UspA family protein